jgi:hypothetical protein
MVSTTTLFVGTNQAAPSVCNVGSTSNAIDLPNGGVGKIATDIILQADTNQNGSMIRYGEEGLVFAVNALDVTGTSFTNLGTRSSIAIDELGTCVAAVSGLATNTFSNTIPVNPPGCVAAEPPVTAPEPGSLGFTARCWGCSGLGVGPDTAVAPAIAPPPPPAAAARQKAAHRAAAHSPRHVSGSPRCFARCGASGGSAKYISP